MNMNNCKIHLQKAKISVITALFAGLCLLPIMQHSLHGAFLDSGWGVRPLGMGGAFTAVADDSNAPLYNPAGLALVKHQELSLMSATLFSGLDDVNIGLNSLSYVYPLGSKLGGIGLAWGALSSPSLYTEDTATLGYGRNINDVIGFAQPRVSVGASAIYLRHEYSMDERTTGDQVFAHGTSAAATTADLGFIVNWEKLGLSLGFASRNATSPNVGLLTVDQVPVENAVGLAYYNNKVPYLKLPCFTSALDIVSRNDLTDIRFGAETRLFAKTFAVRVGASQEAVSLGLGYCFKITPKADVLVDYAFQWPLQVENSTGSHWFGITIRLP